MIRLITFPPAFGLCTSTPFGLKVDAYLRMTKIPYELVGEPNPRKGPKKKLPVLDDGGTIIADSALIVAHLKAQHGDPLDAKLGPQQKATMHLIRRMIEEGLYWPLLYSRWVDDETWPATRAALFGGMPAPLRMLLPGLVRGQLTKALVLQGTGRHSREQIYEMATSDLFALSTQLGEKAYFVGDEPTSLDATAYGFLAQILLPPLRTPMKRAAEKHANLVSYVERFRDRYYPSA